MAYFTQILLQGSKKMTSESPGLVGGVWGKVKDDHRVIPGKHTESGCSGNYVHQLAVAQLAVAQLAVAMGSM